MARCQLAGCRQLLAVWKGALFQGLVPSLYPKLAAVPTHFSHTAPLRKLLNREEILLNVRPRPSDFIFTIPSSVEVSRSGMEAFGGHMAAGIPASSPARGGERCRKRTKAGDSWGWGKGGAVDGRGAGGFPWRSTKAAQSKTCPLFWEDV